MRRKKAKVQITGYAAFTSETFINVEISAQLLLGWELWQHELNTDLSSLHSELEKLRLPSQQNPMCSGLPYLVTHPITGGFDGDYSLPIVDSTAYLLYDYWCFNPFAPGKPYAGCRYDKFAPLIIDGQGERFPRIFHVGQDLFDPAFPQEINDGNHKQIVIEFTTSQPLLVPVTLTVDTVDRAPVFTMNIRLDNGNHCLDGCERSEIYMSSGETGTVLLDNVCRIFLPVIGRNATFDTVTQPLVLGSSNTYTYQLVLEGASGWGVFDWLQLEIPNEVLWTIGNKDNRCVEFDNIGFTYPCN